MQLSMSPNTHQIIISSYEKPSFSSEWPTLQRSWGGEKHNFRAGSVPIFSESIVTDYQTVQQGVQM